MFARLKWNLRCRIAEALLEDVDFCQRERIIGTKVAQRLRYRIVEWHILDDQW